MWEFIAEALQGSGPALILFTVTVLVGAALEWWVWGYVHRREIARVEAQCIQITSEKDYWRNKAMTALGLGEEISRVATTLTRESP